METIEIWRFSRVEKKKIRYYKYSANKVYGIRGSKEREFFVLSYDDKPLLRIEADDKGQLPGPDGILYFDGFNALRKLHKYATRIIKKRKFLNISWQINIDIKDIVFLPILIYLFLRAILG